MAAHATVYKTSTSICKRRFEHRRERRGEGRNRHVPTEKLSPRRCML